MTSLDTLNPFRPGSLVILTLVNPREKFWGMILRLAPEGISLRGMDLSSFDSLGASAREGEPFTPSVVFFPMHRIERAEADLPVGDLPSLSQRFVSMTGLLPSDVLASSLQDNEASAQPKDCS